MDTQIMKEKQTPWCVVDVSGLKQLSRRPPIGEYCGALWGRRHFIRAQAVFQANRETRQYRVWRLWLIINPFLDVLLYAFLFGVLLQTSRGIENFIGFVIVGVVFMRMITGLTNRGSLLLRQSRGLIKSFQFPRAAIVLAQTGRHILENTTNGLIAIGAALLLQVPEFHWTSLLAVPIFLTIHVFGAGLMFITARMTAVIPDLQALISLFTQAWFFLSGVMYDLDRFSHLETVYVVMKNNPAYVYLKALRDAVLYGEAPDLATWCLMLGWALGSFLLGFVYFWAAEERYVKLV